MAPADRIPTGGTADGVRAMCESECTWARPRAITATGTPEETRRAAGAPGRRGGAGRRDRMIDEITTELGRIVRARKGCPTATNAARTAAISAPPTATSYFSRNYVSRCRLPAALWPQASQAVIDIAARLRVHPTSRPHRERHRRRGQGADHQRCAQRRVAFGSMVAGVGAGDHRLLSDGEPSAGPARPPGPSCPRCRSAADRPPGGSARSTPR